MANYSLPSNAYYTSGGAIAFRRTKKRKDVQALEERLLKLEKELDNIKRRR